MFIAAAQGILVPDRCPCMVIRFCSCFFLPVFFMHASTVQQHSKCVGRRSNQQPGFGCSCMEHTTAALWYMYRLCLRWLHLFSLAMGRVIFNDFRFIRWFSLANIGLDSCSFGFFFFRCVLYTQTCRFYVRFAKIRMKYLVLAFATARVITFFKWRFASDSLNWKRGIFISSSFD